MSKLNERLTLFANLSVVVGIVFLGAEMRLNTQAIQAQTRDSITEKQMTYSEWIATNPETADSRLTMTVSALWSIYENAYFARERAVLGDSEWARFERQICQFQASAWALGVHVRLTPAFRAYVESSCTG